MSVQYWIKPDNTGRRVFAYTPIIFKAVTDSIEDATMQIYKGRTAEGTPVTLTATSVYDDTMGEYVATFDAAPIVRVWFARAIGEGEAVANNLRTRAALYTNFTAKLGSNTYPYFVQNAVSQTGADGNKTFSSRTFFQDWRHLQRFEGGYPLVSFAQPNDDATLTDIEGNKTYTAAIQNTTQDNGWWQSLGLADEGFTFEDIRDIPCEKNGFRWINRKGGIEQYVFIGRAYKTKTAKTTTLQDVYMEYPEDHATNRIAVGVDGARSIKVGVRGANADLLDLLTKMPYSPCIEWWDEANDMWTGVTIKNFSHTERTDAKAHDIEIEFDCPAIRMQFD